MATSDVTKYDEIFLGILQNCGKIEPFLDAIFNFLSRRTDFFLLMHKKDDKLGFPPGYAEKMTIKIFEKYQERVLKNDPIYMKWKESRKIKDMKEISENAVSETNSNDSEEKNNISDFKDGKLPQSTVDNISVSTTVEVETSKEEATPNKMPNEEDKNKPNDNGETDCFNGGKTDKYCWSQTLTDVDIKIPIPSFVTASKDLNIEINSRSLNVSLKNEPPRDSDVKSKLLISGQLSEKIRTDESLWSLSPGEHVEINLEKFEQRWWDGVFEGDEKIDKSTIDTTQQVHDFDEQTQGDIRKVMYDQQQKLMGKPTSDEQKTHQLLEKAWDAEGSPFQGTPFDPSKVNLGNNNVLQ